MYPEASQQEPSSEFNSLLTEEYDVQIAIYNYEEPIRNCLWFMDEVVKVYFFNQNQNIYLFMFLVLILVKSNITSIIYLILFYKIYT